MAVRYAMRLVIRELKYNLVDYKERIKEVLRR